MLLINCSDCLPVTCYYLIEYHLCTHLLSGHVPGLSCSVWFSVLGLSVLAAFPTSCTCSVELIDSSIVVIVVVVHCDGLSVDDITRTINFLCQHRVIETECIASISQTIFYAWCIIVHYAIAKCMNFDPILKL